MKTMRLALIPAVLLASSLTAWADDDWKDDRKKRRHGHKEYKEEYWDGNCKVKREVDKRGGYKEERECKPPREVYYQPAPVYITPAPARVVVQPGIRVDGTVFLGN